MSQYFLKLGFTDDASLLVSKAIRKVTGGPSHALVEVFEIMDNGKHARFYFESIGKVDKATLKSGVRGPIPFSNLVNWVTDKPSRKLIEVPDEGYLPLTQEEAAHAVRELKNAVNVIHYAPSQIATNFIARMGVRIGLGAGTPFRWTCCETPLRTHVLPPRFWDLIGVGDVRFDEFWPGGSSRFSLFAGAQRVVDKFGILKP